MSEDDLEAIDVEPVDLEPGDLDRPRAERMRAERRRAQPRPAGPRHRAWLLLPIAGLMAWAAIALTTSSSHPKRAPTTPAPTSQLATPAPDVGPVLGPRLRTQLANIGSGRFAAVIDDRLYVLDASMPGGQALVRLPAGDLTITDHSGRSLLASASTQTLITTRPIATRAVSTHDTAIRAVAPQQWWLLRDDGTIRDDRTGAVRRAPAGLRIVAAVQNGFVALHAPDYRWVLWSGSTVTTIAPLGYQLLDSGPDEVAFKSGCGYNGCGVELIDVTRRSVAMNRLSEVPEFAAFSPDGSRLALDSTQGDVYILDGRTGVVISELRRPNAQDPAIPFSWTPDSRALLVVDSNDIRIVRASDGVTTRIVAATQDLQQLVALP